MPTKGFTLIETLVALAVFSLAALALLRLNGASLTSGATLEERVIAGIVAGNRAAELLTDREPPAFGTATGVEENAGRLWQWTQTVTRSPDARLQRIDIAVSDQNGNRAATLTAFRRVG